MRRVSRTVKKGSNTSSCGTTRAPGGRAGNRAPRRGPSLPGYRCPASEAGEETDQVVLPAPFGPSRPKNSPCSIFRLTPDRARTLP